MPDTNIIQSKIFATRNPPSKLFYSTVVLGELMTACNDTKELKSYQDAWKLADKNELLVVPIKEDWLEASRIQFLLAQDRKKDAGGRSLRRTAKVKQELALDCLIALSAYRENITVITNDNDFWAIRRYLKKLKLLKF